jgi:hypothetical protein
MPLQLIRLDSERRISPDLRLAFYTTREDDKVGHMEVACMTCVDCTLAHFC